MSTGQLEFIHALASALDWDANGLSAARAAHANGDDAGALAQYLAHRRTVAAGYSSAYVQAIRAAATEQQRSAARDELTRAFSGLTTVCPRVLLRGVTEEVFFLGATAETLAAFGHAVADYAPEWPKASWGTAGALARLLPMMLAVPECPDAALIPPMAWMLTACEGEWNWSRTWDETMLGVAGHNWWLNTWLGLFTAGAFFPEFPALRRFRPLGAEYFERELMRSTTPDGFTRERSGYHWVIVEDWLRVCRLEELGHVHFSPAFRERLAAVMATLWKVTMPNGSVPRWGDTGARYSNDDNLPYLRRAAIATGQGELKFVAESLAPDWQPPLPGFWPDEGENRFPAYAALPSRMPAGDTADTALPDSGYYLMRTDWTRRADALTIAAGAFGTPITSHDHTHVFPLEFFARGEPLLVDNCSGHYGDNPARRWRVGSSAHNVVTVDGEDHIPILSEWRWAHPVMPEVLEWRSTPQYAIFQGAHEGYLRLPNPVSSSKRTVFWVRGRYAIVIDRFTAPGDTGHQYTAHFHLRGNVRQESERSIVTMGDRAGLALYSVPGTGGAFSIEPCPYPLDGYDNPVHAFHGISKAGNTVLVTLLVPFESAAPRIAVSPIDVVADGRTLSPFEATGLEIVIDGTREVYVQQHMHWTLPWRAGGVAGAGRFFHSGVCPAYGAEV